ncbi:HAD family hydrolase [Streptomyces lavendulocolor]|uniref:HAD family hydrolase n=1 Tax=Streptomyces lavendulocolor TaxID=67316 RepID=UPI003C2E020F
MTSPGTVLFDLFGVIALPQSPEERAALVSTAGTPAPPFWDAYWRLRPPYDRGELTGPAYWREVGAALGTRFDPAQVGALIDADLASWDAVDEEMVALVGELAATGWRLALLSNIPPELAGHYEERHTAWLRHFDVRAFSCRTGHAKPDPAAYAWCLRALAAPPRDVLFVDDREENVAAARAAGLRGVLFTGAAGLRAALREEGDGAAVAQARSKDRAGRPADVAGPRRSRG